MFGTVTRVCATIFSMRYRVFLAALIFMFAASPPARAKDAKWFEVSSDHFLLFTDTTEMKGRRLLSDFEQRVAAFSQAFGTMPGTRSAMSCLSGTLSGVRSGWPKAPRSTSAKLDAAQTPSLFRRAKDSAPRICLRLYRVQRTTTTILQPLSARSRTVLFDCC